MKRFFKRFIAHSNYETFKASNEYIMPNVSVCDDNFDVHYNPWTYAEKYLTFTALQASTFKLSTNAVSYSLDNGTTWTTLAANTNSPTVPVGGTIMWKGNISPSTNNGVGTFSSTGNFNVDGNAMSLIYGDNFKGVKTLPANYTFLNLFRSATRLINAKDLSLPATTLRENCYKYMFMECSNLITAPELPATTLPADCYNNMFRSCTSLTVAPNLPAITIEHDVYGGMFYGCSSLVSIPSILPSMNLAASCYNYMFYGCSSLTTVPILPATTLVSGCYNNMFGSCTNITTAPELPATTLVSNCYKAMFNGCSKLKYIKAMFTTTPSTTYTQNWVSGVASSGTFVKNSAAQWNVTGVSGIPEGWTVETASA